MPALKRAFSIPKTEGYSRSIVIATDGYVTAEEDVFDLIRHNLGKANVFPFGIGLSVNRYLIEGMARTGMGEPMIITKPDEAPEKAAAFLKLIRSPVLTGIKVDFRKFRVYDVEPEGVPDLFAERPVILFGKWRGRPMGTIILKGISGDRTYSEEIDVARVSPQKTNGALRYLWARHRIALLSDYNRLHPNDERVKEVTNLGLTYNLLTAYTSFVAVDTQVRLKDGRAVMVKQPLPLPQGVPGAAVGGGVAVKSLAFAAAPAMQPESTWADKPGFRMLDAYRAKSVNSTMSPGESRPRLRISLQKIAVSGGLQIHSVEAIIERHLPETEACLNGIFQRGEILFKVVVDSEGRVVKIQILKDGNLGEEFKRCIREKLMAVKFPIVAGHQGGDAVFTLTIT